MDLLSELMYTIGAENSYLNYGAARAPWAIKFPRMVGMTFHYVARGSCIVEPDEGKTQLTLADGDLLLISSFMDCVIMSEKGVVPKPVHEVLSQKTLLTELDMLDKKETMFICGVYQFAVEPIHPLYKAIPKVIHLQAEQIRSNRPLLSALNLLQEELSVSRGTQGKTHLLKSLVDVLFYYVLRFGLEKSDQSGINMWGEAYKDERLFRVIQAIQAEPQKKWTVQNLAEIANLSRSAFAKLFHACIGETPLQYVTHVRMQKAMEMLATTNQSIESIANNVGYTTGFAFSKSFKRICELAPVQYRAKIRAKA